VAGSEVKLVAKAYFGAGLPRSVGVDVFRRARPENAWKLCCDQPHPDWRNMPRVDYVKLGRAEKVQFASHGEILSVASVIGKPLYEAPLH